MGHKCIKKKKGWMIFIFLYRLKLVVSKLCHRHKKISLISTFWNPNSLFLDNFIDKD